MVKEHLNRDRKHFLEMFENWDCIFAMGNYHWFPSDFVTRSCWLWDDRGEIIIDFSQTMSLGRVGYGTTVGKLSLISLRLCHLVMLVMVNYHWFPSDLVMVVKGNYHWFPSDIVTWLCWLWLIIIDFHQTLLLGHVGYGTIVGKLSLPSLRLCHLVMLVMVNYHWFPSDFVTWSCWLWLIIIDFPQTLSLGCWLWEIIIDFPQTLSLDYWFPSDFVTWSSW
jgi:hypothetical protein